MYMHIHVHIHVHVHIHIHIHKNTATATDTHLQQGHGDDEGRHCRQGVNCVLFWGEETEEKCDKEDASCLDVLGGIDRGKVRQGRTCDAAALQIALEVIGDVFGEGGVEQLLRHACHVCPMSDTCHISHVTCHMLHVSHVTPASAVPPHSATGGGGR